MSAVDIKFGGGERMRAYLEAIQASVSNAKNVRVGFLEDASYPEGDGGARLNDAIKRLTPNLETMHPDWRPRLESWAKWQAKNSPYLHVAQVAFWNEFGTKTARARPAFRNMIRANSDSWGGVLGDYLKSTEYDANRSLGLMGTTIQDQLKDSITEWGADNADLTVHIKRFNKGLTDHGIMLRAVDYEIQS